MIGEFGLLAVFLCPMIFGGITFYYSHEAIHQETIDRWKRQGYDYEKNGTDNDSVTRADSMRNE